MRRVRLVSTLQRILHAIEITAYGVQIFGRKESSFFEMVQETLKAMS